LKEYVASEERYLLPGGIMGLYKKEVGRQNSDPQF